MARVRVVYGVGTWVTHVTLGGRMLLVDVRMDRGAAMVAWRGIDGRPVERWTRMRDLRLARG